MLANQSVLLVKITNVYVVGWRKRVMNAYFVTIYSVSCYTDNVILYTLEHLLRVLIIPLVITFIQTSKLVFTFSICSHF